MAEYKGKKVTLNKPSRIRKGQTSFGKKKFQVFVKNKNDNVVRVTFEAIDARMLRVSLSSFFDMAMVVSRTLAEFG